MCDEIEYNVFYQILQNKFRKKYEMALSNCWTICIPCSPALRGIKIDKEFVDIHILKPFSATSTDLFVSGSENSYGFNVGNETISLNKAPFSINEKYSVNIKCVESGYNKDYQQYKIFVIDRPLSPRFCSLPAEGDCLLQLNQKITSLRDHITHFLHDTLFPVICHRHRLQDEAVLSQLRELASRGVTADHVVTFQAAVQELLRIKGSDLKPRSEKVHRELGLEELIKVTGEVDEHFDRNGERCQTGPVSPLDRELERITSLIEASTQDLSAVDRNSNLKTG
ncbi:Putative uncharacterized protein DDB_G0284213 [Gryllus bimaculatus]|nr:Putative uncharacterized protein DDB_G0284213 [Gryllus bimaculatus]